MAVFESGTSDVQTCKNISLKISVRIMGFRLKKNYTIKKEKNVLFHLLKG